MDGHATQGTPEDCSHAEAERSAAQQGEEEGREPGAASGVPERLVHGAGQETAQEVLGRLEGRGLPWRGGGRFAGRKDAGHGVRLAVGGAVAGRSEGG